MANQIAEDHIRHCLLLEFRRMVMKQLLPKTFAMFIQVSKTFVNAKDSFLSSNPLILIS